MTASRRAIVWLALLIWSACIPKTPAQDPAAEAEVRQGIEELWKRHEAAFTDEALFDETITEDGLLRHRDMPDLRGPEGIREYARARGGFAGPVQFFVLPEDLEAFDGTAWGSGIYCEAFEGSPNHTRTQRRYLAIYKRAADGDWLFHRLMTQPTEDECHELWDEFRPGEHGVEPAQSPPTGDSAGQAGNF